MAGFSKIKGDMTEPASDAFAITTDTDFAQGARAIYVGTAGDVTIRTPQGNDVTFANVPAGMILPVKAIRVVDATTDASDLVGLV